MARFGSVGQQQFARELKVDIASGIRGQNLFQRLLRFRGAPHSGVGLRQTGKPLHRRWLQSETAAIGIDRKRILSAQSRGVSQRKPEIRILWSGVDRALGMRGCAGASPCCSAVCAARASRATSMLAPQPIPVSLLLVGGLLEGGRRFFEGAGEGEEDEVWPFTSKVWAALAVATIRTASRTDLLKADCTMPPPRPPGCRLADNPAGGVGYTPALPSSLRCRKLPMWLGLCNRV
jgi:hypothetical protein